MRRFAPAPTGKLHLGHLKIYCFNFCNASSHHLTLRIDDTNTTCTKDWLDHMYQFLVFFNLGYSYFCRQSLNSDSHKNFLNLLKQKNLVIEENGCIKLDVPSSGVAKINGETINFNLRYKPVLLRSNKKPTFFLSCFADDYYGKITKIIRGVDHNETAFIQQWLFTKLNRKVKQSSINLFLQKDGKKISKSKGSKDAITYTNDIGVLPYSVILYILKPSISKSEIKHAIFYQNPVASSQGYVHLDIEKIKNINRIVMIYIAWETFYISFINWLSYKGWLWMEINTAIMKRIHATTSGRFSNFYEILNLYLSVFLYTKESPDSILMIIDQIRTLNDDYLSKKLSREKADTLLSLMRELFESENTPTAKEILYLYTGER